MAEGFSEIHVPEQKDYPELAELWEASVRATHHFLPEEDILYFRPLVQNEFLHVVQLACIRDAQNHIAGFVGTSEDKIEMLFIHPRYRGKGIGRRLLLYAVNERGLRKVDVNEQNEQAVAFYRHLGFRVTGRDPLDALGKPYPILHLEYSGADW